LLARPSLERGLAISNGGAAIRDPAGAGNGKRGADRHDRYGDDEKHPFIEKLGTLFSEAKIP